jgi:hypothetical protein
MNLIPHRSISAGFLFVLFGPRMKMNFLQTVHHLQKENHSQKERHP